MKFIQATPGRSHSDKNPFSIDGSYDSCWSAFCLLDRDDDQFFTGKSGDGPFSARFGRRVNHLENRLADFLRYENAHDRTVILSFPPDFDIETYVNHALSTTPEAHILRPDDPPVIVHATTKDAWKQIKADGELKAASLLPYRQVKQGSIEEYLKHEPPEYNDYIMFGEIHSYAPEMVVASYQAGEFIFDENAIFEPGVRLYLDNHRIISDALGTRDGLHRMKVHLRLPLQPYLLSAIGVDDLDPEGKVERWTPRAFVEMANEIFGCSIASGVDCASPCQSVI